MITYSDKVSMLISTCSIAVIVFHPILIYLATSRNFRNLDNPEVIK